MTVKFKELTIVNRNPKCIHSRKMKLVFIWLGGDCNIFSGFICRFVSYGCWLILQAGKDINLVCWISSDLICVLEIIGPLLRFGLGPEYWIDLFGLYLLMTLVLIGCSLTLMGFWTSAVWLNSPVSHLWLWN